MPTTILIVLIGAYIGIRKYALQEVPVPAPVNVSWATVAARKDLYGDAVNEAVLMRPGQWLTRMLVYFDQKVVDGIVNGSAALIGIIAASMRRIQNGFARSYALTMLIGAGLLVAIAMLVRMS
jgi:NADH-quinone oxidoreductase subunit L